MIKDLNRPCSICGENLTLRYVEQTLGSWQDPNLATIRRTTEPAYCAQGHPNRVEDGDLDED